MWLPKVTNVADVSAKLVFQCTRTKPTEEENNLLNTGEAGHFYSVPQTQNITNISTRVGTLIVATIYLQLIQNRYMFQVLLSFSVVTSIVYNPLPAMWMS